MNQTNFPARRGAALTTLIIALASLAGCGGTPDRSCDDPERYQAAVEAQPVKTPEDLDQLDEFKKLPLPDASPRPPRPEGSPCLDLPPSILTEGQ